MSGEVFDAKFLAEKLSKLNNSQQSIESLSRLCISHRKEAKQIVETWEKMFKSSSKEQCVSFLYLANDILQNSKKTGSEFVNEFWKVLPAALKHVYENGDEKTTTRLVNIWEERKVFGSRVQSLKDELVIKQGKVSHTPNKETSAIKIVKREPQLLRVKLAVGGFPEKIVSAYHSVRDECANEDSDVAKCSSASISVEKIVKDLESDINQGIKPGSGRADEMQERENALRECVRQLEPAEASRVSLVALLKEALLDQETKLKSLSGQLQIARDRISDVEKLKPKLSMPNHAISSTGTDPSTEPPNVGELPMLLGVHTRTALQPPSTQPLTIPQIQGHQVPPPRGPPTTSFAPVVTSDEESKKAQAAAVAAKLAASTSSAQMFASVLSSLVAKETASMNDPLTKSGPPPGLPEKRQKVEHPPPPMMMMPSNSVTNQFGQSSGMMLNMVPYGFGGNGLPPPPPPPPMPPSHVAWPPGSQPLQPPHQQNAAGGYYQPPGMGLYGSSSQPSTPPVQRQ